MKLTTASFKLGEEVDVQIDVGKATLTVHSIASKKVERGTSKNR